MKGYIFFFFLSLFLLIFYIRTSYKLHNKLQKSETENGQLSQLAYSLGNFFSFGSTPGEGVEVQDSQQLGSSSSNTMKKDDFRELLYEFQKELKDLESKLQLITNKDVSKGVNFQGAESRDEKFLGHSGDEGEFLKVFSSSLLRQEIEFYKTETEKLQKMWKEEQLAHSESLRELSSEFYKQRVIAKEKYWNTQRQEYADDDRQEAFLNQLQKYEKNILSQPVTQDTKFLKCTMSLRWDYIAQSSVSCVLLGLLTGRMVVFDFVAARPSTQKGEPYSSMSQSFASVEQLFESVNLIVPSLLKSSNGKENPIPKTMKPLKMTIKDLICFEKPFSNMEAPLITIDSDDFYGSTLFANINHQKLYDHLPPNYFQVTFSFLWKLSSRLQRNLEAFIMQKYSVYVIALEAHEYFNPTLKRSYVPPASLVALQAEELSYQQTFVPYTQVKWYLRTNSEMVLKKLTTDFPEKIFTFSDQSLSPLESEIVEWFAFGETDDQVITEPSSFGDTATTRVGANAAICNFAKYCTRRIFPVPPALHPTLDEQPLDCIRNTSYKYVSSQDSASYFWKNIYAEKPVIF